MKSLLTYSDYRQYLRDFYDEKKKKNPSYSFRFFARKAGFQSPNYLKLVMDGDRGLTPHYLRKFIKGLELNDREAHYFENLVFYTQAKDEEERCFFRKNLELIRSQDTQVFLTKDQHEALAKWYPFAIKEWLLIEGKEARPKTIASDFGYKFTPQEAKEALETLVRLGLIEPVEGKNAYRVTEQSLHTPDLTRSDAVRIYHRKMMELATASIDKQKSNERCLSGVTVAVRKKDLPEAFKRLHQFRNEMNSFFMKGKPYDSVYQLNFQLFRLDDDV